MGRDCFQRKIIYEIYVRSFFDSNSDGIGDINGIVTKLPYLKSLNIDYIWLTPIFSSPNKDLGYDVSDYYSINPEYGSMSDLKNLIEEARKLEIGVFLDLVLNHSSTEHSWFVDAVNNKDSKYRDFFFFSNKIENNLGCQFGGSAWHKVNDEYFLGLFSDYQVDFNWRNPAFREEIKNILTYYLEMGIAGFRFDVISLISKPQVFVDYPVDESGYSNFKNISNQPGIYDYLQEIKEVMDKYNAISLGEGSGLSAEDSKEFKKYLDYVMTFEQMNLDGSEEYKWNDRKVRTLDFIKYLKNISKNNGSVPLFLGNHDQPRLINRFGSIKERYQSSTLLAGIFYLLPGTPLIYQGDEIGMSNYKFKENELVDIESINAYHNSKDSKSILKYINQKGRDHGRLPLQWNSKKYGGFSSVKPWAVVGKNYKEVNVENQENGISTLNFYRDLLKFAKSNEVILKGKCKFTSQRKLVIYQRVLDNKEITVIGNLSNKVISYNEVDGDVLFSNVIEHQVGYLKEYELRVINSGKEKL